MFAAKLTVSIYLIHLLCCDCMNAAVREKQISIQFTNLFLVDVTEQHFFLTYLLTVVEEIII